MHPRPTLLFDAGGTVCFNDPHILSDLATRAGFPASPGDIKRESSRFIYDFDARVRRTRRFKAENLESYLNGIYQGLGIPAEAAAELTRQAITLNHQRSLWTWTEPWVAAVLATLREAGWRMSVISNADGRVEHQLGELGLRPFFDQVFDSARIGIEKPARGIFEHACRALALDPAAALYIGDTFFIDVWGANRAGIRALHLDPFGFYQDWPGRRIGDLRALPGLLAGGLLDSRDGLLAMQEFEMTFPL